MKWVIIKISNGILSLILVLSFGLLALSSLNCSSITDIPQQVSLRREDSLTIISILKANGLTWTKVKPIVGRNGQGNATTLYLISLGLDTLPAEIGDLEYLRTLELSGNKLRTLPVEIEKLSTLEYLNLRGNQLVSLPEGLRLIHLTELNLMENKIQSLPVNIDVTHLENLELSKNQIAVIPSDFKYLADLKYFSIADNNLDSIPDFFGDLTALKKLDFSGNKIKVMPSSIKKLQLDYLNVGRNRLCFPPELARTPEESAMMIWLYEMDRDWKSHQTCP